MGRFRVSAVILATWLRWKICVLAALLIVVAPAPAEAHPDAPRGRIALAEPCVAVTLDRINPRTMFDNVGAFDCKKGQIGVFGTVTWGVFRNLSIYTDPTDPWELRHTLSQADDETIYVHYSDGQLIQVDTDRMAARRTYAANQLSFVLPTRAGMIDAILIRVEGLQNQRGIAPRPELITGHTALANDARYLALYGIMAGAVFALLMFNMALLVVLRAPYILFYCITAVLMLVVGAAWSGAIFAVLPGLDPTTQVSITLLCTSAMMLSMTFFMLEFIEREATSRLAAGLTIGAGVIGVAASVSRLINVHFAWEIMDRLTYITMVLVAVGITATAALGWARGGKYARNYLIVWFTPFFLGSVRVFWALGFIKQASLLIEISPLIVMSTEALLSAVAVSWRIGSVRNERDHARLLQEQFRQIAETDALTGLLTRRAFLHGVEIRVDRSIPIKLILIDIDHFKAVNDNHGHQVGDEVLAVVAGVLQSTAPAGALIGRLGGEEFGVVIAAEATDAVAERLCRAVAEAATINGISVTISAGVAWACIDNESDWRVLYHAADQALYRSKREGRNRVSHASEILAA